MEPATSELTLRNRHPRLRVDLRLYRRVLLAALADGVFVRPGARAVPTVGNLRRQVIQPKTVPLEVRRGDPPFCRYELAFFLVGAAEMARINETHLGHPGSTDVITFDYGQPPAASAGEGGWLRGDVFISLDDAQAQARQFRTTWPEELTRYAVHALLHLHGFDDTEPAVRRLMKREENRLLRRLAADLPLSRLRCPTKV